MTELVFLLDRSFSMKSLVSDNIGSFNSMIKRQQNETNGKALVSTILFGGNSRVLHNQVPLSEIKPLTEQDYDTRSFATALFDAVGDAILHIRKIHRYIHQYELPLPKTLFVITTDGIDNASRKFSYEMINHLIGARKNVVENFSF